MLNVTLTEKLERQQKMALKIIYGFGINYKDLLERAEIVTLEKRREIACENFANKLLESERFQVLFPRNEEEGRMELRKSLEYKEEFARSERRYRSPLYSMRRLLNRKN